MRNAFRSLRIAAGLLSVALLGIIGYQVSYELSGPDALLRRADKLSWLNSWVAAAPLYRRAESQFLREGRFSKALYARVSEIPASSESSISVPAQIAELRGDLELPQARDPETRLRILTILGMLETNYDAGMARETWAAAERLAIRDNHFLLASRAVGEQGIAAFLLGDIATAKSDVLRAWMVAKVADPAAHVRYASAFGAGLVELGKYQDALTPLDEAIKVAGRTPEMAYPTIAVTAKIQALSGLGKNQQALALATEELQRVSGYHFAGHLYELYQTRGRVYQDTGRFDLAVADYLQAANYANQLSYWRGLTQVDGLLANACLKQGNLQSALDSINAAISSNEHIPDELYFVPRDLALKAEILARMGDVSASNALYEKSADLLDALLSHAPTPTVERQLLNDLSFVYSGYFSSLVDQRNLPGAFVAIERARGRVEAQALADHSIVLPHAPTSSDGQLTALNVELLNTDIPSERARILSSIYDVEQQLDSGNRDSTAPPEPVPLSRLQEDLDPSEVMIEYVFGEEHSFALAVTREAVRCYPLPNRSIVERQVSRYRAELLQQRTDIALAQTLFDEILGPVKETNSKRSLIVVPDGQLHLLPFGALAQIGHYLVESHTVSAVPSGTVLDELRHRPGVIKSPLPYLGVAAWTSQAPRSATLLASIRRTIFGPERSQLVPLPESQHEVETIGTDLPRPSTILLGRHATETRFKQLPLSRYEVIHLALHGFVDPEFPDRSALVFAPEEPAIDDSLLQAREIRDLHLNAQLVIIPACCCIAALYHRDDAPL